ncbi:MAG: hypothetical protein K2V38_28860 [Gemmataceae bacterium]|nr:hypothetical protein [Gemmataceae bacterium]
MSQEPTPNAAGTGGGLTSVLKIAVPVAALVGVIFGVTLLSQYTTKKKPEDDDVGGSGKPSAVAPLVFFSNTRAWDPPSLEPQYRHLQLLAPSRDPSKEDPYSFNVQDRVFQGFYEPSNDPTKTRRTGFWFENRHASPVTVQLRGVSCSACSGGRLAAIPMDVQEQYMQHTALAALPVGAFNPFGVGLAGPAARFEKLDWQTAKFSENPNATFKVPATPASPSKWAPTQWGILELTFSVSDNPKVPLQAAFATRVDGTEIVGGQDFSIFFSAAQACAVSKADLNFGKLEQVSGDREETILLYSATRGPNSEFGDLRGEGDRPDGWVKWGVSAPGGGEAGKFVEVTRIDRVPESELLNVAQELSKQGKAVRVQAAYRVTVALRPRVGEAQIDIGQFERTLTLTAGSTQATVKLSATVSGVVWLADGKSEVDLKSFPALRDSAHVFPLVTQSSAIKLRVVEEECKPHPTKKKLLYKLEPKPNNGGQGAYDLVVTSLANKNLASLDADATVVLEVEGTRQQIRLPVKGIGDRR